MSTTPTDYLANIKLPHPDSHKGDNGKLLIIGGSELFHAASKWSLDIASKFVDMVFYASVPSNNELVQQAKQEFWNGIVIERSEIENYIAEADCILIGPGMTRNQFTGEIPLNLSDQDWQENTEKIVNYLLKKYPQKKWVLDAGALQMVEPTLLNEHCIVTPHRGELETLLEHASPFTIDQLLQRGTTFLIKGKVDQILRDDREIEVPGGNAGMTKGGTGDVLAGLVAALYCSHDSVTAATVASYSNKQAAESLYTTVGPFFNATDLVREIPKIFWQELQKTR